MAHMAKNEEGVLYLSDPWYVEDIQFMRPDLNEDQCIEVLHALAGGFDANNGINWDVVKYMADELYPEDKED